MRSVLLAAALGLAGAAAAAEPVAAPRCESLAAFSTTCATCHEAECSGRLSFAGGPERARTHVRRYAGPLSDAHADELIELLRATKEECRVHPGAATDCGTGPWDAVRLRRTHAERERAWFVPLGAAAGGRQRLALRFDRDTLASVRISTARFETLHESSARTRARAHEVPFSAPAGEPLFVRVQADAGAQLVGVGVLEPVPPP
jgi:hypothetical protein